MLCHKIIIVFKTAIIFYFATFLLWVYVRPLSTICSWLSIPFIQRIHMVLHFPSSHQCLQWQNISSSHISHKLQCHFSSYVQDISTCIAHCCYKFNMSKTKPDTFPKFQLQYCHSQVPVKRQSPHQLFGRRVEYKELSRPKVVNCVTTRIEL